MRIRQIMRGTLATAVLCAASPALAQELSGTLYRADGEVPSQGTLVTAERLGDGRVVARAATGARGTYHLRLTTERLVIRALRIGFEPHVLDTVQLAAGERRELNATLPGTSVIIPAVHAATDSRCRVRPDSASLVAKVFHEARTALVTSQLVSPDGPTITRFRVSNEDWTPELTRVLDSRRREYLSDSLRPFRTASVDSLLTSGFVTKQRDGRSVYRWRGAQGASDPPEESHARTASAGQYRACGIPHDRLVTVQVFADGHEPATMALRIAPTRSASRLDLVLLESTSAPANPE